MEVTHNKDDAELIQAMPASPFLARQYNIANGPLAIIARNVCVNPPIYNVMFLDGCGGPAIGETWTGVAEDKIRGQFIPLSYSVTLKNKWR